MKMRTLLFLLLINVGCGSLFAMEQKAAELLDLPDELIVAQFEGVINTAGMIDEALKNLIKLGNVNQKLRGILNDARTINTLGKAFQKRFSIEAMNRALLVAVQSLVLPEIWRVPSIAIKILAAAGADVNTQDNEGQTALMVAVINDHLPVVQALIAVGADVNARDKDGYTALMAAAIQGHLSAMRALLKAGANVNAQNKDGYTTLMGAARKSILAVVQELIAAGAEVNTQDKVGQTALMEAARGHLPVVQALIAAGAEVNIPGINGLTALMAAASEGKLAVVRALIAAGANVNAQDRLGLNVLSFAKGHKEIQEILKAAGAK